MAKFSVDKARALAEKVMHAVNPCNAPEESLRWRIACTLFPDCFCCAGMRGVVYGIVLTLLCVKVFGG